MKYIYLILVLCIGVFLNACETRSESDVKTDDEFPFSYIHDNFQYGGFHYPDEWDVVAISANVELSYRDTDNPEDHKFGETPYRYKITFGKEADVNHISEEDLEEFNKKEALEESTNRQIYYHTYYEHFATLNISTNGFLNLLGEFEDAETWQVNEHDILVLHQENEWMVNAFINNSYYDLHIRNEAQVMDEESLERLLELIFP